MQNLLLHLIRFPRLTYFLQSSHITRVKLAGTRQMHCGKSGNLFFFPQGWEQFVSSVPQPHHINAIISVQRDSCQCLSSHSYSQISVSVCAARDTHISTSNATKNNLAIHHAPLLQSSCHPVLQQRSSLMRQQNKVSVKTCNFTLFVLLKFKCQACACFDECLCYCNYTYELKGLYGFMFRVITISFTHGQLCC